MLRYSLNLFHIDAKVCGLVRVPRFAPTREWGCAVRATINCAYGGLATAARVSLDRSDAKITVNKIQLSACTVQAEWHLSEQ